MIKVLGIRVKFASWRLILLSLLLASSAALIAASDVSAQTATIVLDGQFDDWLGQPNVPDPQEDAHTDHTDIAALFFTNNPDQDYLYFMAERWFPGAEGLELTLNIDTNNNGVYSEPGDRKMVLGYNPNQGGRTDVDLYDGAGNYLVQVADKQLLGEAGKGQRVEWGVTFSDLGIAPFQTIRVQLDSIQGTRVSDSVSEVQWSPANALGWYLLGCATVAGLSWSYYRRKVAG